MSKTDNTLTERQQFWLSHIKACNGQTLKSYAAEHGLDIGALYEAKSRLKRKGVLSPAPVSPGFVRVEQSSFAGSAPPLCRVHLRNGAVVELACTPEHWEGVLALVAKLP